jgi:hypothetical protein
MDLKEKVYEKVDRIRMAQDRVQWWALVNTVMVLQAGTSHISLCVTLLVPSQNFRYGIDMFTCTFSLPV